MKKGISLIVLVITIIVMIIIAGAIIISLNSSNVISQANDAVQGSDLANARNAVMLAYAEAAVGNNGVAIDETTGKVVTADYYYSYLATNKFENGVLADVKAKYVVSVHEESGIPQVDLVKDASKG